MTHKQQMKIRRIIAFILMVIAIVALMAEPTNEKAENYAQLVILTKAISFVSGIVAIALVHSKREEKEFLENLKE